jgi:transcriptional regulator with XRE-family HTH domain
MRGSSPLPDRLARLRKETALTQEELAEMVGLGQARVDRYERGAAEPSLSALKRLALALGVTIDEFVFEDDERGPDDELRLQFEAISRFDPDEKKTAVEAAKRSGVAAARPGRRCVP